MGCFGSGGGGGGGSSGHVYYPRYMESFHMAVLGRNWVAPNMTDRSYDPREAFVGEPLDINLIEALSAASSYALELDYLPTLVNGDYEPGDMGIGSDGKAYICHTSHGSGNNKIPTTTGWEAFWALLDTSADNPYTGTYSGSGVMSYDPTSDLAFAESRVNTAIGIIDTIDVETDFDTYVAKAVAQADDLFSETETDDAVDAFEDAQLRTYLRELNRFSMGMVMGNATNSTAYAWGLASLSRDFTQQVADYRAKLRLQRDVAKAEFVTGMTRLISDMKQTELTSGMQAAQMVSDLTRIKVLAMQGYYDRDLELAVGDQLWNLRLFQHAANFIAAPSGGVYEPGQDKMSKGQSALAGAFSGAAAGFASGGPIGGVIGGVGGLIGGLFE